MKKVKELQNRNDLGEGRNYGIGFSILNKKASKYETYLPFTACRDYLNDFSYVEFQKKEIGTIYGYTHKLLNCFNNKRLFYLGVNTLHKNKNAGNWQPKEEATKILIDNKDNLQNLINSVEDLLKISHSKIEVDEDILIIKAPLYWIKTTALISVYTLLIRCFFDIKFDKNKDLLEQLNIHNPFIAEDNYMKQNVIKFITDINKYKWNIIDYDKLNIKTNSQIHNFGIDGYLKTL